MQKAIATCTDNIEVFSEWHRIFIRDMDEKLRDNPHWIPSAKQLEIATSNARRVDEQFYLQLD